MGVTIRLGESDDPDQSATATVEYRTGEESYRTAFSPSRVSPTRFVGSLFWLTPGTDYQVRVTLLDPGTPLHCTVIEDHASTRAEITVPSPTRSHYVSPDGRGQACTLANPCALTTGLDRAGPGEAVILRGGVYYEGEISFPHSGEEGAPIIIQGYPGERAILDGAEPNLDWTLFDAGNGIYSTQVTDPRLNLVFDGYQRLYPYKSLKELQSLSWDLPGYYLDQEGHTLYVHLEDNADPDQRRMAASRYRFALSIKGDYVYVFDLTFRHYSEDRFQQAALHIGGSNNLIQGNTFTKTHIGVGVEAGAHRNVIQENEFSDSTFYWPWDAAYDGTHIPSVAGIRISEYTTSNAIARGTVIRRNTVHDTFDGFHVCPSETLAGPTNETDIYDNLIYRVTDDGIETDGYCSNVRIWNNEIHDAFAGISFQPARRGPTYAIRNLIYNVSTVPNAGGPSVYPCCGTSFKFDSDEPTGPVYLIHNTSDSVPGSPGIRISGNGSWPVLYARNNTWVGRYREAIGYRVDNPLDFDYDLIWGTNVWGLVRWHGTGYPSLEEFSTATGLETHGLSTDPEWVNPAAGNYNLQPSSPLVDAGVHIPGINDDFAGSAPDIGAFER